MLKASSIPSDDAFTENSLLSHERDPPTDDTVTANAQVQVVIQTESVAVACHLWDRETMKYGFLCEAATCEVPVTMYHKVAAWKANVESLESCCRMCVLRSGGESEGKLSLELRSV